MLSKWSPLSSPPIRLPYFVWAHATDKHKPAIPTIGFSPPALLYLCLVIFSAWCKQCLTFLHFLFLCACFVKRFAFPEFLDPCRTWYSNSLQQNKCHHLHDGFVCGGFGGVEGRERWCRHSGCFYSERLWTCLLPEPNMWFNPQGTGWHFLNVSAAFCTCLHSSTRHGGEGAPLVQTSKPWRVCLSYARNWHHLTLRKTDKEVIFVQCDVCCLCDEAPTLECKVLNATHRPWICTLIGQ